MLRSAYYRWFAYGCSWMWKQHALAVSLGSLLPLLCFVNLINSNGSIAREKRLPCPIPPFGDVTVVPAFELDGPGKDIDTIDFWEAPDITDTLMFVSAKANSLVEVWKYPFINKSLSPLTYDTFRESNVNGVIVDQEKDWLYISIGKPSNRVSIFKLPQLEFVMDFHNNGVELKSEPNIALLKLKDGSRKLYLSADDIVYIHDAATGESLGKFKPRRGLETLAADNFYQRLYIPDENGKSGIYVYHPDGSLYRKHNAYKFGKGVFDGDAEGILVYTCTAKGTTDRGQGFIVVADQLPGQTEFEFFDRETWSHLGTLKIKGVSNTDGIASFQKALPAYPWGIFVAVNNDRTTVGVGWDIIFNAIKPDLPRVDGGWRRAWLDQHADHLKPHLLWCVYTGGSGDAPARQRPHAPRMGAAMPRSL